MAFIVKVGTFTSNTSTGSQTISCIGFTPTGILFYAVAVTSETAAVDAIMSYGMTDGTRSKVAGWKTEDGTCQTDRVQTNSEIINLLNDNTCAVVYRASFTAFTCDGFTINITTNTDSAAYLINYMAFTGTTNLRVDEALVSSSPDTVTGFTPDVIIGMTAGQGSGNQGSQHSISSTIGWATRAGCSTQQWFLESFAGEDDRLCVGSQIRNDGFVGQRFNVTRSWQASLSSFDACGFTWAGSNADTFWWMAMELPAGIEAFVTTFTKSTTTPNVTQTLPNSTFTPQAYMLATGNNTSICGGAPVVDNRSPSPNRNRGTHHRAGCRQDRNRDRAAVREPPQPT